MGIRVGQPVLLENVLETLDPDQLSNLNVLMIALLLCLFHALEMGIRVGQRINPNQPGHL